MGILLAFLFAPQDMDFTRELMQKRKATLGDACWVFYAYLEGERPAKSAKEAAEALAKKGRMPAGWLEDLSTNASLGEVSLLLCATLGIRGGLMMRVWGDTSRYCYRECVYRKLVRANGPHSAVSGRDLLSIAGKVEEELEKKK